MSLLMQAPAWRRTMRALSINGTVVLSLICFAAVAQEPNRPSAPQSTDPPQSVREQSPKSAAEVEQVFAALDRNGDDQISKGEAAADDSLISRFASVDSSGDGYLSRDEYHSRPSAEPFE
jgi:hypothetical protein